MPSNKKWKITNSLGKLPFFAALQQRKKTEK